MRSSHLLIIIVLASIWSCNSNSNTQFEEDVARREQAAIQKLKRIRLLQELYKSQSGIYASSFDTLKTFYTNGCFLDKEQKEEIEDALSDYGRYEKENLGTTMLEAHQAGYYSWDYLENFTKQKHYFDSLEQSGSFHISEIEKIPFSDRIIDLKVDKSASLLEVAIPYRDLLWDLNQQSVEELIASKEAEGKYSGLKFGNIEAPNNNAGNWDSQEEKERLFWCYSGAVSDAVRVLERIRYYQNEVFQAKGQYASSKEELFSLYWDEICWTAPYWLESIFEDDKAFISNHKVEMHSGKKQIAEEFKPWYEAVIYYDDLFLGLDTSRVQDYLKDTHQDEYRCLIISDKDSVVVKE